MESTTTVTMNTPTETKSVKNDHVLACDEKTKRDFLANLPISEIDRLIPSVTCYDQKTMYTCTENNLFGPPIVYKRLEDGGAVWCGTRTFGRIFPDEWVYFELDPKTSPSEMINKLKNLSSHHGFILGFMEGRHIMDAKCMYTILSTVKPEWDEFGGPEAAQEWKRVLDAYKSK